MSVRCFMLEPTTIERRWLRRYASSERPEDRCTVTGSYHNAMAHVADVDIGGDPKATRNLEWPKEKSIEPGAWPAKCDRCDYRFADTDPRQCFSRQLYRRADAGELIDLREAPPGSMWDAWWYPWKGPDGLSLVVVTPGGEWMIDGRATNCTMPEDRAQLRHHCWIRHGTPPNITVDKAGVTCAAGAGSIQSGSYHGFLRNGEFT